ncbi:MAG: hypothetical protein QOI59_5206 [Gammaproteobacteria bacterium]|jgi:phosphatidylethanolamine-binding protein (PEBP) family uncharacterized protein|nr:hypothetical protein [Gammaproteobacteria bacterium]
MTLTLNSAAFAQNHRIPDRCSRNGGNVSPPIEWQGSPDGTQSFALIVEDPDAHKGISAHGIRRLCAT